MAIAALAGVAWTAAETPPPASRVESWDVPGVELRLTIPHGWGLASDPAGPALMLVPPGGKGQIAVVASPLPAAGSPDLASTADSSVASLKESIRKFKLLGRREVEVAGVPAVELYFKGRVEGGRFRWIQTVLLRHGRQVIFMYAAPEETYTDHLGDYDQLLRSVRSTV